MKKFFILLLLAVLVMSKTYSQSDNENAAPVVKIANGILQGTNESGIRTFKGIPFASPPVGNLRWREP